MVKYSHIGALWSALVLPGAGQFVLKRYITGVIYSVISLASLAVIIVQVIKIAKYIVDYINNDAVYAEEYGFISIITSGLKNVDTDIISTAFIVFLVIWFFSILDAFRVGHSMDKNA